MILEVAAVEFVGEVDLSTRASEFSLCQRCSFAAAGATSRGRHRVQALSDLTPLLDVVRNGLTV